MSSPDHARVPRMNDPTNKEKEYCKIKRLWRHADCDGPGVYCWRIFLVFPMVYSLFFFCLPVPIVGVWALVQGTTYFSIEMLPTTSVIIVSALLVIVSVVVVLVSISQILFVRFSGAHTNFVQYVIICLIYLFHCSLPIVVIALGITAFALIPSLSETTQLSVNTTFNNYLSDQSVQENFDNVQNNLKCCGVEVFTDYESIFDNVSVPVSCCNTTNPLANETMCLQIVSNAQQANQAGLIYSEGCVPQLQSDTVSVAVYSQCCCWD